MCIFLTSHLLSLASRTVTVGSKHLKAFLHSWLLLSNAYGIFHASLDYLTNFFPYEKTTEPLILYILNTYAIELVHEVNDAHFVFVALNFDVHVHAIDYARGNVRLLHAIGVEFHSIIA